VVDQSTREALLDRFRNYLEAIDANPTDVATASVEGGDLFSLFVEMAALRSEVRTESRLVKEAIDQFRSVFDLAEASHISMQQALRRSEADREEARRLRLRPFLLDLVEVRDRLIGAATASPPSPSSGWRGLFGVKPPPAPDREGLRMILGRFDRALAGQGIVPFETVGTAFDPQRARAVATVADASRPSGIVVEEYRAGYLWGSDVLRPAEVAVNRPETHDHPQEQGEP
jgi:molecular chaperone GrpE